VALTLFPIQDILTGTKRSVRSLPVEMAEEAREENIKILKGSSLPKENLTGTDRTSLRAPRTNAGSTSFQQLKAMP
jgi:hypothetical protein